MESCSLRNGARFRVRCLTWLASRNSSAAEAMALPHVLESLCYAAAQDETNALSVKPA